MTPHDEIERVGFVVVRSQLDAASIGRLRVAFGEADGQGSTQHVEIDDDTPHATDWRALAAHPLVVGLAEAFLGPSWSVHLHGRNPQPGGGQQGLHADAPDGTNAGSLFGITLIWMLDPFSESNGSTRIVPGTHARPTGPPRSMAQPAAHHPDELVVCGEPGDVLAFSAHLWHSGRRNDGDGPRRSVQMTVHGGSPPAWEQNENAF